ncbi:hypothetical protein TTHERM_000395859 (macronuclear) [Tetrahymena thermophila SB210]|uniref:Uncharacterized protein n=1 Tax=Tetrahymena thermophila (strain SB210) TaxID=312017 RepID=W7XJF4_TETTS|nr:hypothetical protein TTHERM_000395859 [Tetrahymena thermophila SB210]EWS75476.1 hypothetical protein TTHERM_000395859 [Tetrahymena thermophila SB210]|eukprot:XP_012651945.1 hypothetical protein TTHERM_000395859 [Tetrahymena thermophila SB210]
MKPYNIIRNFIELKAHWEVIYLPKQNLKSKIFNFYSKSLDQYQCCLNLPFTKVSKKRSLKKELQSIKSFEKDIFQIYFIQDSQFITQKETVL